MPFSEKIKLEVKKKSCFRCVICHKPFVEIHHIVPESAGGNSFHDNAVTLCSSCHDLFGGNPDKRKQIKQMRDHWYEQMEKRYRGDIYINDNINEIPENINMLKNKGIALYHYIYEHEDFNTTAQILFNLLKNCQKHNPNQKRFLYLDIEGHRNSAGGFDNDMLELQKEYMLEFLMQFFTEIHTPLYDISNNKLQRNDIPEKFFIVDNAKEAINFLKKESKNMHIEFYSGDVE